MKENKIKVLMVEPGEHPKDVVLDNNLDALQKAVSIGATYQGLIEIIGIEDGVNILCNEESKIIGLEGNRRLGGDILTGVFYVVGEDEEGELASLSNEKLEEYKEKFWEPEYYTEADVDRVIFVRLF